MPLATADGSKDAGAAGLRCPSNSLKEPTEGRCPRLTCLCAALALLGLEASPDQGPESASTTSSIMKFATVNMEGWWLTDRGRERGSEADDGARADWPGMLSRTKSACRSCAPERADTLGLACGRTRRGDTGEGGLDLSEGGAARPGSPR